MNHIHFDAITASHGWCSVVTLGKAQLSVMAYALVCPQFLNSFGLTFRTTFPCTFVYDIIIYVKKWAFNVKIKSGTTTQKWSKRPKEISREKVRKIEKKSLKK